MQSVRVAGSESCLADLTLISSKFLIHIEDLGCWQLSVSQYDYQRLVSQGECRQQRADIEKLTDFYQLSEQ